MARYGLEITCYYAGLKSKGIAFKVIYVCLQTGSGKTYTMMGEIGEMDGKLDEDCGITPRVFEYLFTRIKEVRHISIH